jgi:uncharacterized protein DUF3168
VSATRLIQTAIYGVLTADATLMAAATGGVHNDVPEGQIYPHVLISRATETQWHTMGGASSGIGWKNIIRTHTFSRYQGDLEALQIHERIVALLNYQTLSVSGFTTVIVEYEQGRMLVEDVDKIETRHMVGEFCVRVHQ